MKDLRGRTALLTGASGGLAPYIASRLSQEGVELILSARNLQALEALSRQLPNARVVPADLDQLPEVERLAAAAAEADILVSNASVLAAGRIGTVSLRDLDRAVNVNLRAPVALAKLLSEGMAARGGGHIVLMASIAGKMASADYPIYSATKFGIRGLGFALREDLKQHGIGVSLVSPTFVSGAGMWAASGEKAHPLAGEVHPEQVAEAVLKAIRANRREVNVMPLMTRVSTRLAGALPEIAMPVAELSGAAHVAGRGIERQREREGVQSGEARS